MGDENSCEGDDEAIAPAARGAPPPPPAAHCPQRATSAPAAIVAWADLTPTSCAGSEDSFSSAQSTLEVTIVPLPLRRPEYSIGSELHSLGDCKPCAWFWRPQGCSNGEECRHCHTCDHNQLKIRKKAARAVAQRSAKVQRPMLLGNTKPPMPIVAEKLRFGAVAPMMTQ